MFEVVFFCIFLFVSLHPHVPLHSLISRWQLFLLWRLLLSHYRQPIILVVWFWCWIPFLIHTFAFLAYSLWFVSVWTLDHWASSATVTPATFTLAFAAVSPAVCRPTLPWEKLWLLGSLATKNGILVVPLRLNDSELPRKDVVAPPRVASCSAAFWSLSFWGVWPQTAQPFMLGSEEISCLTVMFNQHKNNLPEAGNCFLFAVPSLWTANILCWFPHIVCILAMAPFSPDDQVADKPTGGRA